MTAESAVKHRLATDKRIGSFIQFVWLSALLLADDEGVGGEAWTCDGQTNEIFLSNSSVRQRCYSMVL